MNRGNRNPADGVYLSRLKVLDIVKFGEFAPVIRRDELLEFLERLIKASLPRIRDFRGVSPKGFDGHGNYTLGVSDQAIFPEVELDKIKRNIGFDVTIVTTARTNEEAKSLLSEMGMPFSDRAKKPAAPQPA